MSGKGASYPLHHCRNFTLPLLEILQIAYQYATDLFQLYIYDVRQRTKRKPPVLLVRMSVSAVLHGYAIAAMPFSWLSKKGYLYICVCIGAFRQ